MSILGSTTDKLLLLVISLFISREIYNLFFHPLSIYPGPPLARLTNLWRFLNYFSGTQHTTDAALHAKYGPIIRISPNYLLFSDVAAYQAIYGFNAKVEKGDFYSLTGDPRNRHVFQARGEQEHRFLRGRLVFAAFMQKNFYEYEPVLEKSISLFAEKLGEEQKGKGDGTIDIAPIVKRLTADTTIELVWGESQGVLDAGYDKFEIIKEKEKITRMLFGCPLLPWLNSFLCIRPVFMKLRRTPHYDKEGNPTGITALTVHLEKCLAAVTTTAKTPHENEKDTVSQPSVLKNLSNVRDDDKRKIKDPQTLLRECINMTFAGPGSTAAALTTVLYSLGLHRDFQSLIRSELLTLPPSSPYTSLWALPQFNAFVRESLRLSPPFPGVFERVIALGAESVIPGVKSPLKVGTRVGCNPYVLLRSKEVFGKDAETFRVGRWLGKDGGGADEGEKKKMEDGWIVFGRGSRACIGRDLALMSVVKVVAEVLRNFEIESVAGPEGMKWENHFEMHYERAVVRLRPLAKQ